jgi:predicted DNA-binding protein (UPF0251 family)
MNYVLEIMAQAEEPRPFTMGETEEHREKPTVLSIGEVRFPMDVSWELDVERRIYRRKVVRLLHRYMRYSMDVGRLPSLVGREFFRSKVSQQTMVTFEDRVIFVHDMENCLDRLDDFTREVLGRVVLQEYEHEEAAQLLGCTRMTVHRKLLEGLDRLTDILLEVDLLSPLGEVEEKSCQEGEEGYFCVSDCEQEE